MHGYDTNRLNHITNAILQHVAKEIAERISIAEDAESRRESYE